MRGGLLRKRAQAPQADLSLAHVGPWPWKGLLSDKSVTGASTDHGTGIPPEDGTELGRMVSAQDPPQVQRAMTRVERHSRAKKGEPPPLAGRGRVLPNRHAPCQHPHVLDTFMRGGRPLGTCVRAVYYFITRTLIDFGLLG